MTAFELRVFAREITVHRFDTVGGVLDAIVTMIDQLPTLEDRNRARKLLRERLTNVGECSNPEKRWFRSRAAANKYQRRYQPPIPGTKERLYPYECSGGGHWHLTHYTPAQMAAARKRINQPAPYEEPSDEHQ
ncbi:hypothetical protein [Mycolicibacterium mucogenicum]|uniref:Uncharacterized protein n=1 Tax=Mycolicibacterium mucogenicum DSM 44124 TaxID=1226753 RepID=A0A8H2J8X9_MYCMU|nr:hypothetical protein [Mycolicibacterium mucogenicum]KAB7761785.1 hypothetical protein MMUC44124_01090 [Mycolicibacterium mucogenicum DSM 44124]QPG70023.1 hypothetical protein C1S78_003060 [Mycolicibacterium mucogenicum DSM 44124]